MNEPAVIRAMLGLEQTDRPGAGDALPAPARTLAVVGLSDNPSKPSHYVSAFMQRAGYRILPVNPGIESALGEQSYPSLRDLPVAPDIVNVFRLPRFIPALVEEMSELGFRNLWVQLGIVHLSAAQRAEEAGLRVVMDRCIQVEYARLAAR